MAESLYFGGADASLTVGGTTVAVVKGWGLTITFDTFPATGMDSIKMKAIARGNAKIEVKFKFLKFNPDVASWWLYDVLDPLGEGTPGEVYDTSRCKFFDIVGQVEAYDGVGAMFKATVKNCTFESIPFSVAENAWTAIDMTAIGQQVEFANA